MKLSILLILILYSIAVEAQRPGSGTPTTYDKTQDYRNYESNYEQAQAIDYLMKQVDSLKNVAPSTEIKILAAKVNIMEGQIQSLKQDSAIKDEKIRTLESKVSILTIKVSELQSPSQIKGREGEIRIDLINGIHVLSLDNRVLRRLADAEDVTDKIRNIR